MEVNDYYSNNKSITEEEEESLLLKRLIALQKELEDDNEPKLRNTKTLYNTKENVVINKNIIVSSKFKYRKINNYNVNKFLSTKLDNRNFTKNQNKFKQNNLFTKTNNLSTKTYVKVNSSISTPYKNKIIKKKTNPEIEYYQNTEKYNLEINEIVKNSHVKSSQKTSNLATDTSETLLTTIDNYIINIQDYLTSSKYVVNKEDISVSSTNQLNNTAKNVHVNRKFQDQLISNKLLSSNLKNTPNSLVCMKRSSLLNKKKNLKKLSGKLIESPHLVKIGNTKLIRQSLIRNKWKINHKINCDTNCLSNRKPLSTLQCPTPYLVTTSYNKNKWTNVTNPTITRTPNVSSPSNSNKLKWTRPNLLLVNNTKNNNRSLIPQSDKLILFGKNKIIRQSLINSVQSNKNYLLKHFSHRFALLRKLQQKSNVDRVRNVSMSSEQCNILLSKKIVNKSVEIKKRRRRSYSLYSYVNPKLSSKNNNNLNLKKNECSNIKSSYKLQHNIKPANNDKNKIQNLNLTRNNQILERLRSKKTLTKQLCLVFNRLGVCSKLDEGKCDKRHYKKYITLCTKFLTGECLKENCALSHIVVENKIPFCKHYLNSVCVQLNCPFLHEYRDSKTPICKDFLHGYCTFGKKCPKKHLNLCPTFESKDKCPHGQKCLYPHIQSEGKLTVDGEINEPRYFEIKIPSDESINNEFIHIVPKRHAPLTDLPSYIPLNTL